MRFLTVTAVIIISLIISKIALACSVPPEHMYQSATDTIDDAEWIARVKGVSWEDLDKSQFSFRGAKMEVIEYLKGSGPDEIVISPIRSNEAHGDGSEPNENNYAGHKDTSFWIFGGRNLNDPDCLIHASVLVDGSEYLVFGPGDYNYGFENIAGEEDIWLNFVKSYLKDASTPLPIKKSAKSFFNDAYAVVLFKAEWKSNGLNWTQNILSGPERDYASMLYAAPDTFFSNRVNPRCEVEGRKRARPKTFHQIVVIERNPIQKIDSYQSLSCAGADFSGYGSIRSEGIFSNRGHVTFIGRTGRNIFTLEGRYGSDLDFVRSPFLLEEIMGFLRD